MPTHSGTGRKVKMGMPPGKHPAAPVVTSQAGKDGWTVAQALDLIRQGYSPEQVKRTTGHDVRGIAKQRKLL